MWYLILNIILTLWVFCDAKKRKMKTTWWAVGTFLLPIVILPFYFANRSLKKGEIREGGRGWNIIKSFALFWTLFMAIAAFWSLFSIGDYFSALDTGAERAGAAIGTTIGFAFIAAIWFFPVVGALIIGLFLKKSSVIEKGPTGSLEQNDNIQQQDSSVEMKKTKQRSKTSLFIIIGVIVLGIIGVVVYNAIDSSKDVTNVTLEEARDKCNNSVGKEAIVFCKKVLNNEPTNYEAGRRYDYSMVKEGRGQELIDYYSDLLASGISKADTYSHICRVYSAMKLHDKSIDACHKAIEIDPSMAYSYAILGNGYEHKKDYSKAIKYYDIAIQKDPQLQTAYTDKIYALIGWGKINEAQKVLEQAFNQNFDSPILFILKGNILVSLKEYHNALKVFEKGMEKYPDDVKLLMYYGGALSQAGKNEEALIPLQKATEVNYPEPLVGDSDSLYSYLYKILGLAQYQAGQKRNSLYSLRKSLTIKEDESITKIVGMIEKELGVKNTPKIADSSRGNSSISIGTPFRLGDFIYTIKKVQKRKQVGNQFYNFSAQDGATLLLVKYDIKNEGNETKTVMTDDFMLKDYKGRTFRSSSEGNTAYLMDGGKKDILVSEVQPGLKKEMASVFEIPNDSFSTNGLQLIVPEKGWGSKKVVINLN